MPIIVGYGNQTKFDVSVKGKEDLLRKALVSYIGTASDFAGMSSQLFVMSPLNVSFIEPNITLVLSPITITPRTEQHGPLFSGKASNSNTRISTYRVLGTIPTIGDALIALDKLTNLLTAKLRQISDINAELVNKDQIGLENIQEVGDLDY